jgi:hypothetical protein
MILKKNILVKESLSISYFDLKASRPLDAR